MIYELKADMQIVNVESPKTPYFGSNSINTIESKLKIFIPKVVKYITTADRVTIDGIEKFVKDVSSTTSVRTFDNIEAGNNLIEPNMRGAYFSQPLQICNLTGEIIEKSKTIFVRLPETNAIIDCLKLMGEVIHETIHVLQEESFDWIGKLAFVKEILKRADFSSNKKHDTLAGMVKIFSFADLNMQKPLLFALNKKNSLPCPVNVLNDNVLNQMYIKTVNCTVDDYIAGIIKFSINKFRSDFPEMDVKSVLHYVTNTAKNERMAYRGEVDTLKMALSLPCPTDLDYRIMLYDRFINVSSSLETLYSNVTKT